MKTKIKKIISVSVLLLQFVMVLPAVSANDSGAAGEKRKMLVTAYYSPLPDQSFYIRGSYQADIRLNGRGTNGADGTEVYAGMMAAPRTYPFGTRIRIPGLGVGEVHDRGGAIFAGRDYDRIDVWMGRGEEGLARALNWGARLVEGEVFRQAYQVEPGINFNWISSQLPARVLNRLQNKTLQNPAVFSKPMVQTSEKDIKELQEALTTFGYYHGPVNGVYGPLTRQAVLTFQVAEGVIPATNSPGAGNFGPQTRAKLKEMLENYNIEVIKEKKRLEENKKFLKTGLGKKAEGEEVIVLQRMLWELGYYNGSLTGDYDGPTMNAVFNFQKDQGILESEWDRGAGYYGKQTHAALTAAVDRKIEKMAGYPMEIQTWVPAKPDLPSIAALELPEVSVERQEIHFVPDLMTLKPASEVIPEPVITRDLEPDDRGALVTDLQDILIRHGYLSTGLNTGYYGEKTQAAVLKFQLEKGIVTSSDSPGAGRVGPKTRESLNSF